MAALVYRLGLLQVVWRSGVNRKTCCCLEMSIKIVSKSSKHPIGHVPTEDILLYFLSYA